MSTATTRGALDNVLADRERLEIDFHEKFDLFDARETVSSHPMLYVYVNVVRSDQTTQTEHTLNINPRCLSVG